MTTGVRPVLLGYVRGDVLRDRAELPKVEACLLYTSDAADE